MNCQPYCGPRDEGNAVCINCEPYNSITRRKSNMERCLKCGRMSAERNHYTGKLICYWKVCSYQEEKMDLQLFLGRLETDFFSRIDKKTGWGKIEIKREFNEAIKNTLILTYSRIQKDAEELKDIKELGRTGRKVEGG
jgi:hypothetical protein